MTPDDRYFLSAANAIANTDQREREDMALRLIAHPDVVRAKGVATWLLREVFQHTAGERMTRFADAVDEYVFHYAMRAAASDGAKAAVVRFMTPPHHWFGRDVPGSRWGADSPDFCYRMIPVSHGGSYVIHGRATCANPPTAHYALMGDNTAAPAILSLLDGLDVVSQADGSFTITIDAEPAQGRANHIQTVPGAFQVWVRDALGDWNAQSPNALRIEMTQPPPRDPASEDDLARWAAKALLDGVYYAYYISAAITTRPANVLNSPGSSAAMGGMASQYTASAHVVLEPDEAMIVTASGSGALFRNAVLTDVFMNSLDYWDRTGSLNHAQMAADEGGLFTYVIAHADPGVHNWLDTGGVRQSVFGQRWQSFPGNVAGEVPTIAGRVVKFADLDRELPAGVRRIDAGGRREQLAARRAGYDRRFADR